MHAVLFVACGGVLLFVQYIAVNRILGDHSSVVTSAPAPAATEALPAQPLLPSYPADGPTAAATTQAVALARFVDFKSVVLDALVGQSLVTLGVLTVLAAALGWWTAGRSLARPHTVTAAARHISERNLDDRLALVGPSDEIKELGDTFDAMLGRLDRAFVANRRFAANASHELRTPLAVQRTALEIPRPRPRARRPQTVRGTRPARHRPQRTPRRQPASARQGPTGPGKLPGRRPRRPDRGSHRHVPRAGRRSGHRPHPRPRPGAHVRRPGAARTRRGEPHPERRPAQPPGTRTEAAASSASPPPPPPAAARNSGSPTRARSSPPPTSRPCSNPSTGATPPALAGSGDTTGSGLGLSIVRAVVDSHGGTVEAEARGEGGLTVVVRLPGAADD
ncbi:HAMP domain-containing protein [Yinghuangia aomiensis]